MVWVTWNFSPCQELRLVDLLFILNYKSCSLSDDRSNNRGRFRFGRGGVVFLHDVVVLKPRFDSNRRDQLGSEGMDLGEKFGTDFSLVEDHYMSNSGAEERFHRNTSCLTPGLQSGKVVEVEVVISKHF